MVRSLLFRGQERRAERGSRYQQTRGGVVLVRQRGRLLVLKDKLVRLVMVWSSRLIMIISSVVVLLSYL